MNEITRKTFMKLLAAGGAGFLGLDSLVAAAGEVRGPASPWARLKFPCRGGDDDDWNVHPNGDLNLIDELRATSASNVEKRWNVADISRLDLMASFPFLFMHSERAPDLGGTERANLREYLLRGGFLFAEDCVNGKGRSDGSKDEFFRRMAEVELARILPEAKLERLPYDHPVFHCFHHFNNGLPHMQGIPHGLHGLILNGRVVALLSPSDIHCGWANGDQWFGRQRQVEAMQMGANIYLYALTSGGPVNEKPSAVTGRGRI
jgi:hypothetical protein